MRESSRTLEITIISGENLNKTDDAYVVVRAESIKCCTTRTAKASGNADDSTFLSWNEKLFIDVPAHARSITFEVQCKKSNGAARTVGVARIGINDFLGEGVPDNCLQVLSYGLRDWEGRRNGVIHFAVRVAVPEECTARTKDNSGERLMRAHVGDKKSCGIVAGVPFWWNYPNII
ncbi:hypothetical protein RIF29_15666 [Crotalaria pallida]|uniref:C2 domain-containing protein n=1 Tax=Crotalaria pallida TaxID=3830 RepID=A0AAN9IEV1_CROPI